MVFVQLLWSSHNICNNLQSSWVLNIKVEESTRSWLFFARTVFFQNWAPRKSHFLHSHTLVQLQTLCWWWFSHINEIERWSVYYARGCSSKWCLLSKYCRRKIYSAEETALSCWGLLISSNCWGWHWNIGGRIALMAIAGSIIAPPQPPPNLVNAALSGMTEGTLANSRFSLSGKLSW